MEIHALYSGECLKKQTKISENVKLIKKKPSQFNDTHLTFLCEISSLCDTCTYMGQTNSTTPYNFPVVTVYDRVKSEINLQDDVLGDMSVALKETHQLCRKKSH